MNRTYEVWTSFRRMTFFFIYFDLRSLLGQPFPPNYIVYQFGGGQLLKYIFCLVGELNIRNIFKLDSKTNGIHIVEEKIVLLLLSSPLFYTYTIQDCSV